MSEQKSVNRNTEQRVVSRRDFLRYSAMGALASLAAACAAPAAAPQQAAPAAPAVSTGEPLTIKMMSWFWWEPGRADAWRAMIEKFHNSQNDIRVEEGGWPFNQFTNNIIVQLQAGKIDGDVITTTPDLVLRLLKAGKLAPVEDILTNLGIKDLSKAHDYIRRDGHLYGLDVVTVAFGLLYNSQNYEEAGITDPPTTIDEWIEVTEKLTNPPDKFGIFSPHLLSEPEGFWFILQEWAMPYDGIWAKGQTPLVDSPEVINGLKLFKTMYDCCMPQGTDTPTSTRMYANGRIAQQLIVSAAVNVWKTEGPEVYPYLRSAIPPWPSRKSISRIHPICVNVDSDKQEAAMAFIEWLYAPEHYSELLERALDVIPSYPEGIRQEYLDSLHWVSGYNAIDPITPPEIMGDFIFNNQEFGQIVITKFQESLTTDKPVEDAMAEAQVELEALADRLFS